MITIPDNDKAKTKIQQHPVPVGSKIFGKVFSYFFHPLLIPIYVGYFLLFIHSTAFAGFSDAEKKQTLLIISLNLILFPLLSVLLLKALGFVSSLYLPTQKDRIIPYIASGIFFFWAFTVFKQQPLYPRMLVSFILGIFLTSSAALLANIYLKVSMHAFGLGFIIGPVIGGLLGTFGPRIPFMVAAGLCFLNFLYGYFVLPESLKHANRRAFDWKRANPLGSIKRIRNYHGLGGLFISLTLIYIAAHAIQSNWTFFTKHKFNWDETMIGISLGFVGVMIALVQGLLIRYINPRLGNERSVYFGLLLYAFGLLLFAFAGQGWMMFAILVPYCIGGIAGPALQSLISGKVPMNEQGELQGAITSLVSLTAIIGPLVMTGLFAFFTGEKVPFEFPGAPFLLASILMLISALVANKTLKHQSIK